MNNNIHKRNWKPTSRERAIFHDFVEGDTVLFLVQKYDVKSGDEASLILRRVGRYYERFHGQKTKAFYIDEKKQAFRDFTSGKPVEQIQERFGVNPHLLSKMLRKVGKLYETFFKTNCRPITTQNGTG